MTPRDYADEQSRMIEELCEECRAKMAPVSNATLDELDRLRTVSDIHASGVAKTAVLVADKELKRVADNAIAEMMRLQRERDEARAQYEALRNKKIACEKELKFMRERPADRRIAELEAALQKIAKSATHGCNPNGTFIYSAEIASAALSPAPAQPATAAKWEEEQEARIQYVIELLRRATPEQQEKAMEKLNASPFAAPPSPAASEATTGYECKRCGWRVYAGERHDEHPCDTVARCCRCSGSHGHPEDDKGCYYCVEHYPQINRVGDTRPWEPTPATVISSNRPTAWKCFCGLPAVSEDRGCENHRNMTRDGTHFINPGRLANGACPPMNNYDAHTCGICSKSYDDSDCAKTGRR